MPIAVSRVVLLALAMSWFGCSITLRVSLSPTPEPDAIWYRTLEQQGSPRIWPITESWHPLGGSSADLRRSDDEVPFVNGSATTECPRRSGLFKTLECSLGRHHDDYTGLGSSPAMNLKPSPLFARPKLTRDGPRLAVKGLSCQVTKVPFALLNGIAFVHLDIDNRSVSQGEFSDALEPLGWVGKRGAWVGPTGARKTGTELTCRPGEQVALPLYFDMRTAPPWELWHLPGRTMTGDGLVERATWVQWRDAEQHSLLSSSSSSKTANFVCPELNPGDVLALLTDDGSHPEFVYVALLSLTRR